MTRVALMFLLFGLGMAHAQESKMINGQQTVWCDQCGGYVVSDKTEKNGPPVKPVKKNNNEQDAFKGN